MPENNVNISSSNDRNCGCGGFGLFGGNNGGCCGNDSTILFFIIIFLLLFTNFGCCGCNR